MPVRSLLVRTGVSAAVVVAALLLWRARTLIVLLVLVVVVASAVRPGVDSLARRRIPRAAGVLLHYAAAAGVVALILWLVTPPLVAQLQTAGQSHGSGGPGADAVHQLAAAAHERLSHATVGEIFRPALSITEGALRILGGIALVLAGAAFWTLERERLERLVTKRGGERGRTLVRDWDAVEVRLGSYVRGQLALMGFVACVLSAAFWAIGEPYWLAVGIFAGVVEIVPIVGPLLAGILAVGSALTVSVHLALLAAGCVYGLRLFQDYVLGPRVLGHASGLPPLVTLVAVSVTGLVLGPACVPIATPVACIVSGMLAPPDRKTGARSGHAQPPSPEPAQ